MAKKKINPNGDGFLGDTWYKSKPKPYVEGEFITNYRIARDRVLYQMYPHLREELKAKYGKS